MRVGVKQADRCASIRCSKTKELAREHSSPRPASPETETQGDALLSCLPSWGPRLRSIPTITEEWSGLLGLPGWRRDDEASVGRTPFISGVSFPAVKPLSVPESDSTL